MTYTPQPGTIPHRAIAFLEKQPPGTDLAAAVICEDLGVDTNSFSVRMKLAREAGLVRTRKEGRLLFWGLGDGTPDLQPRDQDEREEAPAPAATPEFNAALWADGDLVIYGAQENEDGSITLSPEQLAIVKRLVAWSPVPA
jgi:hypothetical protein